MRWRDRGRAEVMEAVEKALGIVQARDYDT
jgi:hypothetical protein